MLVPKGIVIIYPVANALLTATRDLLKALVLVRHVDTPQRLRGFLTRAAYPSPMAEFSVRPLYANLSA